MGEALYATLMEPHEFEAERGSLAFLRVGGLNPWQTTGTNLTRGQLQQIVDEAAEKFGIVATDKEANDEH